MRWKEQHNKINKWSRTKGYYSIFHMFNSFGHKAEIVWVASTYWSKRATPLRLSSKSRGSRQFQPCLVGFKEAGCPYVDGCIYDVSKPGWVIVAGIDMKTWVELERRQFMPVCGNVQLVMLLESSMLVIWWLYLTRIWWLIYKQTLNINRRQFRFYYFW